MGVLLVHIRLIIDYKDQTIIQDDGQALQAYRCSSTL